jgi:hypothetical protein
MKALHPRRNGYGTRGQLQQYTTMCQAEMHAMKACAAENTDRAIKIETSIFYLTVKLHLKHSTITR